jgi:protein phosphatase
MRLRVGAASDAGRVRTRNEDAFALRAEQGLFVVCDGMGGAVAGEIASRMAVEGIVRELNEHGSAGHESAAAERGYLPRTNRLAAAVRRSNTSIFAEAQKHSTRIGMGTTVVGAWIEHNIASVAHVGDSRAYLYHAGRLEPLTTDHSLVEAQVRAGLFDREAGRQSEQQNVLLRVLGRESDVDVDVSEVALQRGDYLLLCSDGLTRMVAEREMADIMARVRHPQRICDALVDAANRRGGTDNITVVIVQVADSWWRQVVGFVATVAPFAFIARGGYVENRWRS